MSTASVFSPLDELAANDYTTVAYQLSLLFRHRSLLGADFTADQLLEHASIPIRDAHRHLRQQLYAVINGIEESEGKSLAKISAGRLLKYEAELEARVSARLRQAYKLKPEKGETLLAELRKDPLTPLKGRSKSHVNGRVSSLRAQSSIDESTRKGAGKAAGLIAACP